MLSLLEVYEEADFVHLVLEYQQGGTLHEYIKSNGVFSEGQAKIVMEQLLLTVDFFHQHHVVHRDIKLDNILIYKIESGDLNVKIADLGLATVASSDPMELLQVKCGTPAYMAPEILRDEGYREQADIFSLGVLFFNIISGHYLFRGVDVAETIKLNKECDISFLGSVIPHISRLC